MFEGRYITVTRIAHCQILVVKAGIQQNDKKAQQIANVQQLIQFSWLCTMNNITRDKHGTEISRPQYYR